MMFMLTELHPSKQLRRLQGLSIRSSSRLQGLSDTRWARRYFAIDAVCCMFDSLLAALEEGKQGKGSRSTRNPFTD